MKKIVYITSILMAAILFTVWSCSKEEVQTTAVQSVNLSPHDAHINKIIKHFKEEMAMYRENPGFKSGESVPADSALWYLEATINYSHAFPNEYYKQFEIDTSYLTVPVNADGTVDMDLLTQKYDEMIADVSTFYYNSSFEDKGLVLVDLSETAQTDTELTLTVETVTGEKGNEPPPPNPGINGPFEEGDDWWYGELLGHCDPHTPNSTDAAKELYTAMNDYITSQNTNVSFPSVTSRTIKGGDINAFDRLFSTYDYDGVPFDEFDELCLDWQEMNVHFSVMKYLIYTKLPDENVVPAGYIPVELTYHLGFHELIDNDIHYYHKFTFKFGFPIHRDDDGPEEL